MPADIRTCLAAPHMLIADGAIGTYLQMQGLPAGTPGELWNVEHPEVVCAMHQAYLDAGAQILTTNTFSTNRVRLPQGVGGHAVDELARKGVELARSVAGDEAWVAGSLGPTGRLLEPLGDLSSDEAEAAFAAQAEIMAQAGADLILIETMADVQEAAVALRGALRAAPGLPVFVTFAFDGNGRTMMGNTAADAGHVMEALGATAVGANCGQSPEAVVIALQRMAQATSLPLIGQPNAGIPQLQANGQTTWDGTPDEFAARARALIGMGVRILGACCGSTPVHIAAIRAVVDTAAAK